MIEKYMYYHTHNFIYFQSTNDYIRVFNATETKEYRRGISSDKYLP